MEESNTETRLKNLPFLPARIREFAYRYAFEIRKTRAAWGAEFNVKCNVIDRWLKYPGMKDYVAILQDAAREETDYLSEIKGRLKG